VYPTKKQAGASYLEHLAGEREEETKNEDHHDTFRGHRGHVPSLYARSLDD
jgi:hypothetical protein